MTCCLKLKVYRAVTVQSCYCTELLRCRVRVTTNNLQECLLQAVA